MKKSSVLLIAAAVLLSSCGTAAQMASSDSGQRFADGIYSSAPSIRSRAEKVEDKAETQALVEKTKASQIYLFGDRKDTVMIPDNMAATIKYDREIGSTVVSVYENPYDWRNNIDPWYYYSPYSVGSSWYWSRHYNPWYYTGAWGYPYWRYSSWYFDPWYYGGFYDPWYYGFGYAGYWGWYDPWYYMHPHYAGWYGGWYDPYWGHHHHHHHPGHKPDHDISQRRKFCKQPPYKQTDHRLGYDSDFKTCRQQERNHKDISCCPRPSDGGIQEPFGSDFKAFRRQEHRDEDSTGSTFRQSRDFIRQFVFKASSHQTVKPQKTCCQSAGHVLHIQQKLKPFSWHKHIIFTELQIFAERKQLQQKQLRQLQEQFRQL